ncbi:bifunctional 4-hydroxy-2-oxoglutarate aldolase/2-dehydro-3-deoxy-phosphogluconate aldolase [Flammeovirga kamogawensis]|uniref:Bifunctional 4-hydroxy-2-oxoglutarate aldolase/2-dehydro-3-deoxy-phosphogluconate aldolase n=1 Tax=Flammeovirga kamogawensis TaxID=373891 RepID=A0ABX8H3X7_9BACT|nr:bifunctional 4-hydroxy-2-oxoglutarate aldolase/2-dehydro-3-deoxy-phosphogluconate aldolase [Flammeovirga kamogawensis]MBB6461888.1 2-dehydro-3-deoxyphosphogluconate aldolase/(4S)-4-hydroxy-2-oxoglutarate aldolase [Flammeovirga kamogawensis]QWG10500.1 bifunctional 4-hydroxy-2-oxoglutarate aldolase/2-dehydro-3-deoxy-phosphogluconate aldolase [Flammeovirga kamogawensis]TRX63610.1 bifunctional 4-hydroxy-2-oxoglutarate aldolase/2-dehydro-3-deoxy-phosphogluconate aldolase [Flammeovirga kamogawensis
MAKFSRIEVATMMKETGMIPVFYHKDIEVCKKVVSACYNGGARAFEFTNRGDFAHEIFAELAKFIAIEYPKMALGIGSLVDAPTTALYLQLGADFVVSPILNPEMAKICNRRKVSWSPGCGTLTEISYAEELGAEVVKIFPGEQVGGPEFVKAAKGPCPWSSIMPTGGVKPEFENLKGWFNAGVHCVGIGSQLMVKDTTGNFDYTKIEETVKEVYQMIGEIRTPQLTLA